LRSLTGNIAFQRSDKENSDIVRKLWEEIPSQNPSAIEQRREVAKLALNLNPISQPGSAVLSMPLSRFIQRWTWVLPDLPIVAVDLLL
jgi:hypothetical protein